MLSSRHIRARHQIETSRASRSPQRSRGATPAAIAASIDWGRSLTGTATAPTAIEGLDALRRRRRPRRRCTGRPLRRRAGQPQARLAERGRRVDPALAGHDEVRFRQPGVEVGRLHQEFHAGPQRERSTSIGDRQQREADATCGPRARDVADVGGRRPLRGEIVAYKAEATVELGHSLPARRPSAGRTRRPRPSGRAAGSRRRRPRPDRCVTSGRRGRARSAQRRVAVGVGAQAAQQSRAAVGRGASADPEHDRSRTRRPAPPGSARPCRRRSPRSASRSPAATRDSPDASAISTTARAPSADRSQRAWIGRPSGSRTLG